MFHAGLLPERTTDPGRAFHLWSSDGAVILATDRTDATGMLTGAQEVFGPRLFVCQSPATVAGGTIPGSPTGCGPLAQDGTGNAGVESQLHIDGYAQFGDYYPDLVFVLCERPATSGGESFLVDGQRLLGAIASDPGRRALNRFLWDVKVEHGRPDEVGAAGAGKHARGCRPVASRTCGGRLTVRCHPHQRLPKDVRARPDHCEHLAAWARITEQAARIAPRFTLRPGELLCLDNYRIFHGREHQTGSGLILHMLWAWTDMAFGLPYTDDLGLGLRQASSRSHTARHSPPRSA